MWFSRSGRSVCATFHGQSTLVIVTQQAGSFEFVPVVGWTLGWAPRKQNNGSEWSPDSGHTHFGSRDQWPGAEHWLPSWALGLLVFCSLQLLVHQVKQKQSLSAGKALFLSFLTEREPLTWLALRRVVRFRGHPWTCPGQWGNSLINSVAGLDHAGDSRSPGPSGYSKLTAVCVGV